MTAGKTTRINRTMPIGLHRPNESSDFAYRKWIVRAASQAGYAFRAV
ncbi:hypothetical protein C7S14_5207 [Burkholderia cepacia]|nr:hypothetical protein C7S14_5207 [Burkholderia cepacia]